MGVCARRAARIIAAASRCIHYALVITPRSSGVLAIPFYLFAVGAGHVWLAMQLYERTTGLPRDGQAFSGTAALGVGFVVLGILATVIALRLERSAAALARGAIIGVAIAAAGVGYTASTAIQGYVTGGTPGELRCIVEQGREICPPGDGTWIAEARTDPIVILAASALAYVLANAIARYGHVLFSRRELAR